MNIFSNEINVPVISVKAKTDAPGTYVPTMRPNITTVRLWLFQLYAKVKKGKKTHIFRCKTSIGGFEYCLS